MEFKDFYKATETLVVLGGLFCVVAFGKLFAYITAIVYCLLNLPKAWAFVKKQFVNFKRWF